MKKIFTSICIALMAMLALPVQAQRIYLIKGNKVVETYSLNEVDYMSFDLPADVEAPDFDIEIGEVGYNNVSWKIIPRDAEMTYYTGVYTEDALRNRYEYSVDKLCEILFHDMSILASMVGMTPEDFMEQQVLAKGEQSFADYQQGPDSEYVILAFGCSNEGKPLTKDYSRKVFATPPMEMNDLKVGFDIDNTSNHVKIKFTPSDKNVRYLTEVRPADQDFGAQDWVNTLVWRGSISGRTPEESMELATSVGDVEKIFELDPNVDYVVYAYSVEMVGEDPIVNSRVSQEAFTSGAVAKSDITFELTTSDITPISASITMTPSNNDIYSYGFVKASEVEGLSDMEIAQKCYNDNPFAVDWNASTGSRTVDFTGLDNDTEYVLVAFGYEKQEITSTNVGKITFRTLPGSDPAKWVATFGDIKFAEDGSSASVDITVNYDDLSYVWFVVPAYGTEEQIKEAILAEFNRTLENKGYNYVELRSITGSNEVSYWPDGGDDEEVKFVAIVANTDFEFLSPLFSSKSFKMSDAPKGAPALKAGANKAVKLNIPKTK